MTREGPNGRECESVRNEGVVPQMTTPTRVELATEDRVKPERTAQRGNPDDAARITNTGGPLWHAVNLPNRRMRTRMSGGVGGGQQGNPLPPIPACPRPRERTEPRACYLSSTTLRDTRVSGATSRTK
jgi:hypothetical protein